MLTGTLSELVIELRPLDLHQGRGQVIRHRPLLEQVGQQHGGVQGQRVGFRWRLLVVEDAERARQQDENHMRIDLGLPLRRGADAALEHLAHVVAVQPLGVGVLEEEPDRRTQDQSGLGLIQGRELGDSLGQRLAVAGSHGGDRRVGRRGDGSGRRGQVSPVVGHGPEVSDRV